MNEIFITERLKFICKQRNLTPYKLSKQCDLPNSTVNAIFTGTNIPSIPTLIRICEGLDITVSYFFQNEEDMAQNKQFLNLWNDLREEDKKYVLIYMTGLSHKQLKEDDINDIRKTETNSRTAHYKGF